MVQRLLDLPPRNHEAVFIWPRGGNTGDDLIRLGCMRFLEACNLDVWDSDGRLEQAALGNDTAYLRAFFAGFRGFVFFTGGGNIGIYRDNEIVRRRIIRYSAASARGVLVLPQSCRRVEESLRHDNVAVWARDRVSFELLRANGVRTELVPDAACFMADSFPAIPSGNGLFLIRRAAGRCLERVDSPFELPGPGEDLTFDLSIREIIDRLAPFRVVASDRLHGGIIAILLRKRTALLPVNYHKTKSFYRTWLSTDPGIGFIETRHQLDHFASRHDVPSVDLQDLFASIAFPLMSKFLDSRGV